MLYMLYRLGKFIVSHIPLKVSYGLAKLVSSAYSFLSRGDREAVIANLRVLFPNQSKKKLNAMAKEIFLNFGKYLVDFFRFPKVDKNYVDKYVNVQGLEHLTEALKGKKGVILLSAHLGNWELGGIVVPLLGIPFASVALSHKDPKINHFFMNHRAVTGGEVIGTSSSLKRCFSVLKDNHALALVGDRDYFDNGIVVDFFGKPTSLPKGPAAFSRRFHSPIIPCFMIRNSDDTFNFSFYEPIMPILTKNEHQDLIETTKKVARIMEGIIKQHPTQWYVFRRFWERIGLERGPA